MSLTRPPLVFGFLSLCLISCDHSSSKTKAAALPPAPVAAPTTEIASATVATPAPKASSPTPPTSSPAAAPATGTAAASTTVTATEKAPTNVMPISVNGSLCGGNHAQYQNEPCVSVTICAHGTSNCQTIDNILLDTGSDGLRLFQSVLTIPSVQVLAPDGGVLAECVAYADGSSDWGPIATLDVQLAGEPAVAAAVQLIQPTFMTPSPLCSQSQSKPDTSPSVVGFNGILGVGLLVHDCGATCLTNANNGIYYSCGENGICNPSTTTVQVQNPVALLPTDNNGIMIQMASVPDTGTTNSSGSLILGIATQANNTPPASLSTLHTDALGNISTVYPAGSGNAPVSAFLDTGSTNLVVPDSGGLPVCDSLKTGSAYYCPSSVMIQTATTYSAAGTVTSNVTFSVGDGTTLVSSGNSVFSNLVLVEISNARSGASSYFDWGLPFFFGRTVYLGFDSMSSPLGSGPFYAY